MLDAILAAMSLPLLAMSACADPAITTAVSHSAGNNGNLTTYDVDITVENLGTAGQPSSLLQSVEVFQNGSKVDQIGVPPLAPHASHTVRYTLQRSSEAHAGTTHLRLQLALRDPHNAMVTDCSTANDTYRLNL